MFISTPAQLDAFLPILEAARIVTLDTEFAAERRYFPRFDLLQLGCNSHLVAIDMHADLDLAPLAERLCDPARTVVLHAGGQDVALLARRFGRVPARIFDTQLAAGFVGYGTNAGYASLVSGLLGVELPKTESLTDWSRRPLKPAQLEYALDDVRHLIPLYDALSQQLSARGRLAWFEEEANRQLEPARYLAPEPRDRWRRLGGWSSLSPRQLSILREVAAWRESHAQREDIPARVLLPDDVLSHLARRVPTNVRELREIRQIFERTVQECGRAILEAVRIGAEASDLTLFEEALSQQRSEPPPAGLVELLHAVLEVEAARHGIAASLLATQADLQSFVRARLSAGNRAVEPPTSPLLAGWRRALVGESLVAVLAGRAGLRFDPETRSPGLTLID